MALKIILVLLLSSSLGFCLTDAEVVAATISGEARGEGLVGMTAVADVIINRVNASALTPTEVCLKPHQFSCWSQMNINKLKADSATWGQSVTLANKILNRVPIPNVVPGANSYCRVDCHPSWAKTPLYRVGLHLFYKI